MDSSSDSAQFERLVGQAIMALPEHIRNTLQNVAFLIEDKPRPKKRRELALRRGDTILGLYEGVPATERFEGEPMMPDKITIFRRPIEELAAGDRMRLAEIVHDTVWHEVGHHLGYDEEEMERLEKRRGVHL